ncbi:MAG: hypothetical protein IJP66_06415 [Kiritimatiellae bacterium]|nr:hypothetical protein [Kiritimatiellia bacterium]
MGWRRVARGIAAAAIVTAAALCAWRFWLGAGARLPQSPAAAAPSRRGPDEGAGRKSAAKMAASPVGAGFALPPTATAPFQKGLDEGDAVAEDGTPPAAPSRRGSEGGAAPAGGIASAPGRFSIADMTFSNHADAVLGNLLTMEDGDDIIGDPDEAYRGFAAAFDKALEEPIAIGDEDDDFQRELKEAVIELREELARRRAEGEDVEEILAESWRQMKELNLYRREIEAQVKNLLDEGMTQEDYESLVGEANRILAEEGVKPLELPTTLKRALRLRRLQAEALEAEERLPIP